MYIALYYYPHLITSYYLQNQVGCLGADFTVSEDSEVKAAVRMRPAPRNRLTPANTMNYWEWRRRRPQNKSGKPSEKRQ
jgi:hypothetical protein